MNLSKTLESMRPLLPYYLDVTKYGLLQMDANSIGFRPDPAKPSLSQAMAEGISAMGLGYCVETYVMSQMLAEGPKVFAFDARTCEALENLDLSVSTADYSQPFPTVVIDLPQDYAQKRIVPFEEGSHSPDFVIVRHEPKARCLPVVDSTRRTSWSATCTGVGRGRSTPAR